MNSCLRWMTLALLVAVVTTGCSRRSFLVGTGLASLAVVGTGGYLYARGDLEHDYPYDHEDVYRASVQSLIAQGFAVENEELNAINARVDARGPHPATREEVKITVKMEKVESGDTHISIRVGILGDEALSRDILAGIERRLSG